MSNAAAVALIADRLPAGLIHPGDGDKQQARAIPMPALSNLGLPPGMADHFAKEAGMPANDAPKLIAEAVVNLLETDGDFEIVPRAEIAELRAQAATLDQVDPNTPIVAIRCSCNPTPILHLSVGRASVMVDGAALRKRLDEMCRCA